jgi:hypothetical protein
VALIACAALAAPAVAKPKPGVLLQWSAAPGSFKQKHKRFPDLKACEDAGLKLTLEELTRVYGERASYADVKKKPRFLCHGPCVALSGNSTFCPITTWDGVEEESDKDATVRIQID